MGPIHLLTLVTGTLTLLISWQGCIHYAIGISLDRYCFGGIHCLQPISIKVALPISIQVCRMVINMSASQRMSVSSLEVSKVDLCLSWEISGLFILKMIILLERFF